MAAAALVIAAHNLMPALRDHVKVDGDIATFADTEPIQALQTIMEDRPSLVVLERLFAATPRGAALINRIKTDQPVSGKTPAPHPHRSGSGHHRSRPTVKPADVGVDIWNGTLIRGLSAATGRQLATAGFAVNRSGLTWANHDISRTIIGYPPGKLSWARLLHKALPGAELRQVSSLTRLRVILGATGNTFSPLPGSSPSPSPSTPAPGSPGSSRTAAQAACH